MFMSDEKLTKKRNIFAIRISLLPQNCNNFMCIFVDGSMTPWIGRFRAVGAYPIRIHGRSRNRESRSRAQFSVEKRRLRSSYKLTEWMDARVGRISRCFSLSLSLSLSISLSRVLPPSHSASKTFLFRDLPRHSFLLHSEYIHYSRVPFSRTAFRHDFELPRFRVAFEWSTSGRIPKTFRKFPTTFKDASEGGNMSYKEKWRCGSSFQSNKNTNYGEEIIR